MRVPSFLNFLTLSARGSESVESHSEKRSAALPPGVSSVKFLGNAYDNNFPNVYRDNGGGGNINGVNFIVWSDTSTTNGGPNGALTSFVSNSIAALEYNDPTNPLNLYDFGSNGKPREFVPRQSNESDTSSYAIWPNTNICGGLNVAGTGLAVYPVLKRDAAAGGGILLYNTLVSISATAYGPISTRLVPQLFYVGEIQYGSFGIVKQLDDYLYFFAAISGTVGPGIKVAKVPENSVADRSKYTYWNGVSWAATPPVATNPAANMFNYSGSYGYGPASGDIYFNTYYNVWMAVFFDTFVDGTFRLMYSTTVNLVGPWSPEMDLYQTSAESGYYNYGGHAYPGLGAGKNLLLSWTWGTNVTQMANVTFA